MAQQTRNRLADSASAYLRSASHQPIDWYEFNEEAFLKAKELDRLILLDIGAVWCHWCHVIDRESYENDEIAALINDNFIPVKVDRDQRPDVDARYQQIISAMTGQGGWPLTAFLAYDGRVMYGGTYFPPHVMKKLLTQLPEVYRQQKAEILEDSLISASSDEIEAQLEATEAEARSHQLPETTFETILNLANRAYDPMHGGFGMQPKFPHYSALEFIVQQSFRSKNVEWHPVLEKTLTEMAHGGVYDQLGGGFHRYSVDRYWHVPHFEKMSFDNAEALTVYAHAYRLLNKPEYRDVVDGILRYVAEVMSDQTNGGFYASQDADIDLEDDGDYFTWTLDEMREVVPEEDQALIIAHFGMTPEGDMHDRPGRNVLRIVQTAGQLARHFNEPEDIIRQRLERAKVKMMEKRRMRPAPFVDTTVYLNWNGMMLSGFFDVADFLDRPDARAFAVKTINRLSKTHIDARTDRLMHSTGVQGFFEDYAWWIQALLKAYRSTGEKQYLADARHWTDVASLLFEDKANGGFYDIPKPDASSLALLKFRRKQTDDTPSSSSNGIMIRNLLQLFYLTEDRTYQQKADSALRMFAQELTSRGLYVSAIAMGLYEHWNPPLKLEVLGQDEAMIKEARDAFYVGKVISYDPSHPAPAIRVCEGVRCLAPVHSVAEFDAQLASLD